MVREIDEWTYLHGNLAESPAEVRKIVSEQRSDNRIVFHARQPKSEACVGEKFGHRAERRGFTGRINDEVEIVRADTAGARKLEKAPGEGHAADCERRDPHQFRIAADCHDEKPSAFTEVRPRRVQPLPRQEETVSAAVGEKIIPFAPQLREAARVINDIDTKSFQPGWPNTRLRAWRNRGMSANLV